MNRLDKLFKNKKENILSIYFTAGFPNIDDTVRIIKELEQSGVDLIEIGIPFSDPIADGPVIQKSNKNALQNGMILKLLLSQLERIREHVEMPIILMGYLNPIMQYGIEAFCEKVGQIGLDGLIVPDLPFDLFVRDYKSLFVKHNLHNINLITPLTSDQRIKLIDKHSSSFIYVVSSSSTTGTKQADNSVLKTMFSRLEYVKSPTLIGFGISDKKTFNNACHFANGAIIGSAFIKNLGRNLRVCDFVNSVIDI
jgi:tryptophan synthase alpha chain